MSLYIFGKLIPRGPFDLHRFARNHPRVRLNFIDPEDTAVLDEQPAIAAAGLYFSITDRPLDVEATALWNEAYEVALQRLPVAHTPLGEEVRRLLDSGCFRAGGIAFVDGGVETVLEGPPGQCWRWFEQRIGKPWDTIDNPLLIWKKAATAGPGRLRAGIPYWA